jgi:hypothetical protein
VSGTEARLQKKNTTFGMEHSYFNLMLYLFQEDCKQSEGYKVGLLNIHMIQDKTIHQTISHSFTFQCVYEFIENSNRFL